MIFRIRTLLPAGLLIVAACAESTSPSPAVNSPADEGPSFAITTTTPPPLGPTGAWKLVFSDEFNGNRLDTKKWRTSYPYKRNQEHGELEAYSSKAVTISNGVLQLTATRQPLNGQPYTSGMVTSAGKFTWRYGVAEIRLKTPPGTGYWPAFWTMDIPYGVYPPEIDMLELKGGSPSTIWMSNYWGLWPTVWGWQTAWTGANYTTGFHTVTVKWTPTSLTWYVDGVQRAATTAHVPTLGMYLVANLAVGGTFAGNPTSSTVFPGVMQVDYIRVWQ